MSVNCLSPFIRPARAAAIAVVLAPLIHGCAAHHPSAERRSAPAEVTLRPAPSEIPLSEQSADSALIRTAAIIVRAAPKIKAVWPGYWPADQAFFLTRPDEAVLLVSSIAPPPEFEPLVGPGVPRELRGITYLRRSLPADLAQSGGFHLAYKAGDVTAPAVPLQDSIFPTLSFLYHEVFHPYQFRKFKDIFARVPPADSARVSTPKFIAMAEVERRILSAALDAPSPDSLRLLLRQYLAVRAYRPDMNSEAQAVECRTERAEGSARLVGYQAALLALGEDPDRVRNLLRHDLTRPLESFSARPGPNAPLMRWRLYGTGAALGYLLDRIEYDWRVQLEQGVPLDELLSRALAFDPTKAAYEAPGLAASALVRFGWSELLDRYASASR
ncbi:MAG TPA: hypothetical protein VGW38_05820 [Chloroflexota bacterium]|nr:hypothetical protein [Chloroflexota bacterium]